MTFVRKSYISKSAKKRKQLPAEKFGNILACAEISGMLKKNRQKKLVSPVKRSAWLHAYALQNFARRNFFDVNDVSIVLS